MPAENNQPTQSLAKIEMFLQQKPIAIAGISRNKQKFGTTVYKTLKKNGIPVIGINPHLVEIDGDKCFSDIETIPNSVNALFVCTQPENTKDILKKAVQKGITHIWLQPGSNSAEDIEFLNSQKVNFINDRCILMFADPVNSVHRFHRFLSRLSGKFPT